MSFDRTKPPEPAAIRAFEFPSVRRRRLGNGLTVLHARHGDLPLVTARVAVEAGGEAERPGEEGLAHLTAKTLETGTRVRTGDDLAWALERLGTQLESWTAWDAVQLEMTVRSDRLTEALAVMTEVIRSPAFPEREVARLRGEQLAEMLRRRSEPRGLADDMAAHYIFGRNSPYARSLLGMEERVGAYTRDDVVAYHERTFTPGATAIVVVGRIDDDEVDRAVSRHFADWTGERAAAPPPPVEPGPERTTVYVVDRPGAVQSELRIGHVGVSRHHEDYYPLLVLNALLGGAFTSRLNLSLREKHGFTYGVRSAFVFRRAAGPFVVQTAVASDVTARAVEAALKEMRDVSGGSITEDEVRAARDFLAGTLPLEMQTTDQLAARMTELFTYDLPDDYFENYRARIGAVTRDDIVRVAREHLHMDRLAIVVVGSADAVREELAALDVGDVVLHETADRVTR